MNPDSTAPVSPHRAPLGLRWLRSVAIIGLCLALTVITALAVIGCLPFVHSTFEQLFSSASKAPKVAVGLTLLFIVLLPLIALAVAQRKRWLTWPVLAAGWLAVLPVLGWLAWDEPAIRQPIAIEEFSPAFAGAEQSYAVLMQYSKQTPSAEAKAFAAFKPAVQFGGAGPREPAKWMEFVTKNREALEADWTALAPQRRWFGELAAFDRLGDLGAADFNANIITFQVWRTLSQRTIAMATLQALDGHGDEAVDQLVPLLEAGRRLQLSSRTLVRTMIGIVVERMTLETIGVVLDRQPVSAASRARLAAALANENGPALARRLLLMEYVVFAPLYGNMKLGDNLAAARGLTRFPLRHPLNFLSALVYNPIATTNLYGDRARELADLAEARELGKFAVRSQDFGDALLNQPGMKNVGGRLMLSMSVPAYAKVIESHWKTADLRTALRERLAASAPH